MGLIQGEGAGVTATNFNGETEEGEPNVTPEEQDQYDRFVKNGMELIYQEDGTILPDVIKRLQMGKPVEALAQTAVWVVTMVENSAQQSNANVADEVVMHAGRELLEQLIEVAEAAEIHTFSEKEIEGAWYSALDMYREATSGDGGRFDPMAASDQFVSLVEADQEGRADDVLPGFNSVANQQSIGQNTETGEEEEEV